MKIFIDVETCRTRSHEEPVKHSRVEISLAQLHRLAVEKCREEFDYFYINAGEITFEHKEL